MKFTFQLFYAFSLDIHLDIIYIETSKYMVSRMLLVSGLAILWYYCQ